MKAKKFLASILSAAIVLVSMGTVAFADDTVNVVKIDEKGYTSLDAALDAALEDGVKEVEITVIDDVAFSTKVANFDKVTFTGTNREQTIDLNINAAFNQNVELVFNNLTVSRLDSEWLYHYFYVKGGLSYNNCKMVGLFNVTAQDTDFIGCDFYNDDTFGDGNYSIWLYNCSEGVEVNITDCTFDVYERAIKMYGDGYTGSMTLNISNTTFESRTADKTVVEMAYDNSTGTGSMGLNITESTASGFGTPEHIEGEANAWFNVEGTDTVSTVKVDNKVVYTDVVPTGSITPGYTSQSSIWGEGGGNANESLVVKLYCNEDVIATASLNNIDGIIDGDVYVTWSIPLGGSNDGYWNVEWKEGYPNINAQPTSVEMLIDGVSVATNNVRLNGPDDLNKIVAATADSNGMIKGYYTTLTAAADAAQDGDTVTLLADITYTKDNATYVGNGYYDGFVYNGDKSFTINLGGRTITENGYLTDYLVYFKNTGAKANEVTLTNGKVIGGDNLWNVLTVGAGSAKYPTTVNLTNIEFIGSGKNNTGEDGVMKSRNGSVINIKSGTVITANDAMYGVQAGIQSGQEGTVNIYDGAKINAKVTAVSGVGYVNIYGGEITSGNSGVFTSSSGKAIYNISGGTITAPLAVAAAADYSIDSDAEPTINITGGTIIGKLQEIGESCTVSVSGGTFTVDPTEYLADGCVIAENNGVYGVTELPTAEVTDIPETELEEKDAPELTFALKFTAVEPTEAQLEKYKDWYADFELTVNKKATFNATNEEADGYLAGEYGTYGWISVPFEDVTLEAGDSLKIMEYAASLMGQPGLKITYNDVVTAVKIFNCGIYFTDEFIAENPDLEVTLSLNMYNPEDETEKYTIGDTYTFNPVTCEWTTDTDAGYYMNGTDKLGLMRWLFMATYNGNIDTIGIEYQGTETTTSVEAEVDTTITGDSTIVFYGDVNGFTKAEATKDSYSARGFVKYGSITNYSDIVLNAPDWDRELNYEGGNN